MTGRQVRVAPQTSRKQMSPLKYVGWGCSAFVDFSAVANSQDDDFLAVEIEDDTIISDPKTVGAQLGFLERFGVGKRIVFESLKSLADALFHRRIKRIDILAGTVGIDQPVRHRPNTWA